jgi:hypothetical protein
MPEPENGDKKKKIPAGILAVLLWIVTAILGLVDILAVRNIAQGIAARIRSDTRGSSYWAYVNAGNWSVVVAAVIWIVVVVGSGEYHRVKVGQRSSWKLFGWTIAVEVAILILPLFL